MYICVLYNILHFAHNVVWHHEIIMQLPIMSQSLAVVELKVTRDDLESKATAVLQSLLPEMWRVRCCRRRLRLVSSEELPWRAQSNLLLGQCQLDALVKRLSAIAGGRGCGTPEWLRFDSSAVQIAAAISIHPGSIAGLVTNVDCPVKPSVEFNELKAMMTYFRRAVVRKLCCSSSPIDYHLCARMDFYVHTTYQYTLHRLL